MRVMVCGPVHEVRGAREFARDAAETIAKHGHETVLLYDIWAGKGDHREKYRRMTRELLRCDIIECLPGCELSHPATEARRLARSLGLMELIDA